MKEISYNEANQIQGGCCKTQLLMAPIFFAGIYAVCEKMAGNAIPLGNVAFAAGIGFAFAGMAMLDRSSKSI